MLIVLVFVAELLLLMFVECNGDGSSCSVDVTFSVDMSIEGVVGDIKVRTSTENGSYSPSDWFVMDDSDGDMIYTYTMTLITGVEYGYNFNNSDGSGYESGSTIADCAGGNFGNDRIVTPGVENMVLDTVCWESCVTCPAIVLKVVQILQLLIIMLMLLLMMVRVSTQYWKRRTYSFLNTLKVHQTINI